MTFRVIDGDGDQPDTEDNLIQDITFFVDDGPDRPFLELNYRGILTHVGGYTAVIPDMEQNPVFLVPHFSVRRIMCSDVPPLSSMS